MLVESASNMKVQEHVPLRELTTLKIGGTARYFVSISYVEELEKAVLFAREKRLPVIVLGGGSNVLLSDREIDAVVVKINVKGIEWTPLLIPPLKRGEGKGGEDFVLVTAGAGESWDGLVEQAIKRGYWGIENLSGIPGTVGAAPIQNIGAYGTEIKDVLEWVEALNTKTGKVRRISNRECSFGYRDSIFKTPSGKALIITRVALKLSKDGMSNLEYKDLKDRFMIHDSRFKKKEVTLAAIRKGVLEIRSRKFPDLHECGTAGSFFKNPIISQEQFAELKKKYRDMPGFKLKVNGPACAEASAGRQKPTVKLSLAWILDNICGLKGFQRGNVGLFARQPLVLVQNGEASAEEIEAFAKEIVRIVKEKTDIDVEWEVQKIS